MCQELILPCFATPGGGGFQGPAETPKPSLSAPSVAGVRSGGVTRDQMTLRGGPLHALSQPPLCCQHPIPCIGEGEILLPTLPLCVPSCSNEDEPLSPLGAWRPCFSSDGPPPPPCPVFGPPTSWPSDLPPNPSHANPDETPKPEWMLASTLFLLKTEITLLSWLRKGQLRCGYGLRSYNCLSH